MTALVNIHKTNKYDVYIGRAGKGQDGYFGNPREHSVDGANRDIQVERFRDYFYKRIAEDAEFKRKVLELKDKVLACFCHPLKCHGMVYIEYLDGITIEDQIKALKNKNKKVPTEQFIDIFDS